MIESSEDIDVEGIVLDFRFTEIEAELFVILEHLRTLEQQLPVVRKTERDRLEQDLEGLDQDEWSATLRWIDEFVDDVLPRLYYSPLLVQLWAVFESGIVEISKYIQEREAQRLSIYDLRANNDFERAQKYYTAVLRFPLIEIDGAQERLNRLLLARNVVAHSNGRVEAIKPAPLQKLHQLEKELGVVLVGTYHVSFPIGFVREMALTVKNVLDDLISRVKEKYE